MNPFSGLINSNLKQIYNNAIDALLEANSLSIPCTFQFLNNKNPIYCNNCIYDSILNRSSNKYNGTGLAPFPEDGLCPVCLGRGWENMNLTEESNMMVIFDSKYWMNWNSDTMNIDNIAAQTICGINMLNKIQGASYIYFNNDNIVKYILAGAPKLAGFGDLNYVISLWTRQG